MTATSSRRADPHVAVAGIVLRGLAAGDLDGLLSAFEPDVSAIAVLPAGVFSWDGHAVVRSVFDQWFGDADELRVTEFAVGCIGERLHLRWRIALTAAHLGGQRHVVDQQLYADVSSTG